MTGNFTHTNGWFFFLWFLNEQRFTFWQVSYKRLSHGWFIWKWKWSLKHLHPRKISLTNENFYQPECLYSSFNFLKKKKEKNKTKKPYLHAENLLHEERFKTRNRRATHAALPGTLECLQLQICRQTRLLATLLVSHSPPRHSHSPSTTLSVFLVLQFTLDLFIK